MDGQALVYELQSLFRGAESNDGSVDGYLIGDCDELCQTLSTGWYVATGTLITQIARESWRTLALKAELGRLARAAIETRVGVALVDTGRADRVLR